MFFSEILAEKSILHLPYLSELSPSERSINAQLWTGGMVKILLATRAWTMLMFANLGLSFNMKDLLQQTSRTGRDHQGHPFLQLEAGAALI